MARQADLLPSPGVQLNGSSEEPQAQLVDSLARVTLKTAHAYVV
jgi:hypothetical protein